jgi:hypothetical protein
MAGLGNTRDDMVCKLLLELDYPMHRIASFFDANQARIAEVWAAPLAFQKGKASMPTHKKAAPKKSVPRKKKSVSKPVTKKLKFR